MTTKELELKLYRAVACKNNQLNSYKNGWYFCFEVGIPYDINRGPRDERVDALCLESHNVGFGSECNTWRCYELKISKSDFHSKAALSWYGNLNYYVMPLELYESVKLEIPNDIGVYVADESSSAYCIKKAKRRELIIPHNKLLFALMLALSREYRKNYRE